MTKEVDLSIILGNVFCSLHHVVTPERIVKYEIWLLLQAQLVQL